MKQLLRIWLLEQNQAAILEMAKSRKRILSYLTALTYDPDLLVSWRAVAALGAAAGAISNDDPEFVRGHLRRLMWLLNDESGGIGWHAPEAMGEIIRYQPQKFSEFIPILCSILDMGAEDVPPFRAGALWAMGRLSQVAPEQMMLALPWIAACLEDSDPQTRGMAAWCLAQLPGAPLPLEINALLGDEKPVLLFQDGCIEELSVWQLAQQAFRARIK